MMTKRNYVQITNLRALIVICTGLAAGILGFDGPLGILFFLVCNVLTSCLLMLRFGFQAKPYFKSLH